jgi:TPR repeat protein
MKELQQAAAKGNPKAEAQLGEMLLRGDRIAKDEARAVTLLEKAARAGNSAAAFRIGMLLANGESGVAKDPVRALDYFRAAAAGGEKEAFFNIGAAYGSARGVKRDYGEALGWLIVARKRGADANAESSLRAQIKAQPAWIAKGERRAKEIEQEFAGKKVLDLLPPPAPLDSVMVPAAESLAPNDAVAPTPRISRDELKPADLLKPIEPPKPPLMLPKP